jgi:hypothetical protein
VIGGVAAMAAAAGRPVVAIVGEVLDGVTLPAGLRVVSLVERCGRAAALERTGPAIEDAARAALAELGA